MNSGFQVQALDDLLGELDQLLGNRLIHPGHLGADLLLEGLELVDGGAQVASCNRGVRGFEAG